MSAFENSGLSWRKSSRSASNGQCVEVAATRDGVFVRDSKDAAGPVLSFSRDSWSSFVDRVGRGGAEGC
ncbi:DUF397 domain-containing protein [Rhizomonospora bruguierae]|uniref:DUF397 domain-containing protein n=1 Tax=Rhizomonospora bruguierae TaxID=1581705 RepID=UPI001BCF30F9|nr:DUF397 domain-containing protein [Micromonospora sp. NBRC 107566]